ncbi:MAG: DUF421 domain-containing protein [Leadbetterella sp.]|nr:DUF421 domain-containing protein [Leadbetterella sp.]
MDEIINIALRSLCVYLFIFLGIRIFGKTELSQLNTGDVVLLLLLSNAVQNAMVGPDTSLTGGLIAALMLFVANYVMKNYLFRSAAVRNFMQGHPSVLVRNGITYPEVLKKTGITESELMESVREHGVENVERVKLAILEIDGNISVISIDKPESTHQVRRKEVRPVKNINM